MVSKADFCDNGKTLTIKHMYNSKFNTGASTAGASKATGWWNFDEVSYPRGRQIALKFFGWDGKELDTVPVKLTAKHDVSVSRGSIEFFGHVIAKASGRDSGAITPPSVIKLCGTIGSGGSVKNWETNIRQGGEFVVKHFPRATFEALKAKGHEKWVLEIYSPETDQLSPLDLTSDE